MESTGIPKSPLGLELTIATPASSGSNGGNGSNMENARELALLDMISQPASGGGQEDDVHMGGVELEIMELGQEEMGAAAGPSSQPRTYMRLSQEQHDELEATFQQSQFPDKRTKDDLAERLKVTPKQLRAWFVNRRSRLKKQQTIEETRKQFESFAKERRRLRRKIKKLKELNKKLKATPMAPPPPPPALPPVMFFPFPGPVNSLGELWPNVTAIAVAAATQQGGAPAPAPALATTTTALLPPPSSGGSGV